MKKLIIALLLPLVVLTAKAQEDDDWGDEGGTTTTNTTTTTSPKTTTTSSSSTPSSSTSATTTSSSDDEFSSSPDDSRPRQQVMKYPKLKWRKKKKIAEQLVKEGSYYNAAEYYEDVLKAKPNDIKVIHALAELNRALRDYKAAETYYNMEIKKDEKKWPNDLFFLAQMQKMNGEYELAKKTFLKYQKTELGKDDISYKSLSKIEAQGCDSAEAWMKNPNKIKVQHQEGVVNSIQTDYAPKPISNNRLLYSVIKADTAINISKSDNDYYSKLYIAEREGKSKEWTKEEILPSPPNDPKLHVGNGIFNADETALYYTQCTSINTTGMHCNLYRIVKNGESWGFPEELKTLNDPEATTTQPALGIDKNGKEILYFVSNRTGKGGLDIFYSEVLPSGKFGQVKNAGQEINTPGDEWTPYYNKSQGLLYFSSNGRPGLGGLDVFSIKGTPGSWGVPINMASPVNSSADDLYFALRESGAKGFVVSNRVGTKTLRGETSGDDIWEVIVNEDAILKAIFVDRKDSTKTPIQGVDVSLYKVEGSDFDFVASQTTTADPFFYAVKRGDNFKVNGNKEGYWPTVENISIDENDTQDTVFQIFYMDKIDKKKIKIENIYFAFDRSVVVDFYQTKLDSVFGVLVAHPGYSVEVVGHTDSKGSDSYNKQLSQKRANEARTYLINKGIAKERIIAIGLGESQPLAPNELEGLDDPEGRARNRRVEFKILTDKPDEAGDIEYDPSEPIDQVKTGPGYKKK